MRKIIIVTIVLLNFIMSCSTDINGTVSKTKNDMQCDAIINTVDIGTLWHMRNVSNDEYEHLARLVYSESSTEPFCGKRAVADVVIYTSRIKGWTVMEVIYDVGRFDGVNHKLFHMIPDQESYEAVRLAMSGQHILPYGVIFFHNPNKSSDNKWVNYISQFSYKMIGNHLFCYHPSYY